MLWHLLSLDAVSVAVLWTWFLARLAHRDLAYATYAGMGIGVWALYAGDRLLDTRSLAGHPAAGCAEHEARHLFHRRYRHAFRGGIFASLVVLTGLVPRLPLPCIRLFLVEACLLSAYLTAVHTQPRCRARGSRAPWYRRLPKEVFVGPFFAAATCIPSVAGQPALLARLVPLAALFAGVCSLNCFFIFRWEHLQPCRGPVVTFHIARHLAPLSAVLFVCALLLAGRSASLYPYPVACAASIALLCVLDRFRRTFQRTTLRAAADAALLTPLLLSLFLA